MIKPPSSSATKILAALCGLAAVLVLSTGSASAGVAQPDSVTVSPSAPSAGGPITITAQKFDPDSAVAFSLESPSQSLGSASANSSGVATLTTTLPANLPAGSYTIRAVGFIKICDDVAVAADETTAILDCKEVAVNPTTRITVAAAETTTTTPTTTTTTTPATTPATTPTTTPTEVSPTKLAATGSSSARLVGIGVVLAVLGGLLMLVGKRRTRSV